MCPTLSKRYHMNLVLGYQTTAVEGCIDDAEAVFAAWYPSGRDVLWKPLVERLSEGRMQGLCMFILLSVETDCADGHQQEYYCEYYLFHFLFV